MPKYYNPNHKPSELEVEIYRLFGYRSKPQFAKILKVLLQVRISKKIVVAKQIAELLHLEPSSVVMWMRELRDAELIHIGQRTRKGNTIGCPITLTNQALTLLMKAKVPMAYAGAITP